MRMYLLIYTFEDGTSAGRRAYLCHLLEDADLKGKIELHRIARGKFWIRHRDVETVQKICSKFKELKWAILSVHKIVGTLEVPE